MSKINLKQAQSSRNIQLSFRTDNLLRVEKCFRTYLLKTKTNYRSSCLPLEYGKTKIQGSGMAVHGNRDPREYTKTKPFGMSY